MMIILTSLTPRRTYKESFSGSSKQIEGLWPARFCIEYIVSMNKISFEIAEGALQLTSFQGDFQADEGIEQ